MAALLMSLFLWMAAIPGSISFPTCQEKFICSFLPTSPYQVHGEKVPVGVVAGPLFKNDSSPACRFNLEGALSLCYEEPPGEVIHHTALVLKCVKRHRLVFETSDLIGYNNNVLQIQIHNCKLGLDDINWLGKMFDLRVVLLINTEVLPSRHVNDSAYSFSGLKNVVSMSCSNTNSTNRLETLFPRPDIFRNMAEIALQNMSIDILPSNFSSRMPNLQTLDLAQNALTEPPEFPWYQEALQLPRNLSRTNVFNTQYTTLMGIHLAPNLFRRSFYLNNNRIRSLDGYRFQGWIQMLTLARNQLLDFPQDTLANVTGLQRLDLSMNNLSELHPGVFDYEGLKELWSVNLGHNKLQQIANSTFNPLASLVTLNLAGNRLSRLWPGAFANLVKLETLHLEDNELQHVSPDCFPTDTTSLNEVILKNNLLKQIPLDVFTSKSLKIVDLSGCQISLETLNETLSQISVGKFHYAAEGGSNLVPHYPARPDRFKRVGPYEKVIRLAENEITSIPVFPIEQYKLLLVHYKLDLAQNPIDCSCSLAPFLEYINAERAKGNFDGTEYLFSEILCSTPQEHQGKSALSLKPRDLYCSDNTTTCPKGCKCFRFYDSDSHLLDCSESQHSSFVDTIPDKTVEVRLNNNIITTLGDIRRYENLVKLDLSYNQISSISPDFFEKLPNLKFLNLRHNVLTTLPESISYLNLAHVLLSDNHFRCDCHTVWMKEWLLKKKDIVEDWNRLMCILTGDKIFPIITVPDQKFTCPVNNDWKLHVPIIISAFVILGLVAAILVYRFRLDLKALLFVRLKLKIFEKKLGAHEVKAVDTFVIAAMEDVDWTRENVFNVLRDSNLLTSVAFCWKDFYVGLSHQDNFELLTDNSTKIVVVLSRHFFQNDSCVFGLERGVQISLSQRTSSLVVVKRPSFDSALVSSASVRRFLRAQKSVKDTDKLLKEKLLYSVAVAPVHKPGEMKLTRPMRWERRLLTSLPETNRECCYDVYIANGDSEGSWVSKNVSRRLETEDWVSCVPDRDFPPGHALDAMIVASLQKSRHALIILSEGFARDEWCLFVFRAALQMSLDEHRNFLIVLVLENTDISQMNNDIQSYLRSHSYVRQSEADWWQRLTVAMTRRPEAQNRHYSGQLPDVANVRDVEIGI